MSKKKNKKKNKIKNSYLSELNKGYGKGKKSGKKNAKPGKKYRGPKETLDKKEIKRNKAIITTPVEIDKKLIETREKCNHAGKLISVDAFKAMTVNYAAYSPLLENAVELFGAENVSVCKSCYDVVVDPAVAPTAGDVNKAITVLYAACNFMASTTSHKDEVKKLNKMKADLTKLTKLMPMMNKVIAEAEENKAKEADRMASLNANPVGVFTT